MTEHPPSRIKSDVDFDKDGRQTGFLRLAHSVNSSAYGHIPIPIAVFRNGEGPTALLMGGSHGDEWEGQVALCNLIRTLDPARIKGRVIVLPAANLPASLAGARVSPIDAGNLNRLYPGVRDGTPTEQIAYYIEHELLRRADIVFDMHSGGSSLMYVPSISVRRAVGPKLLETGLAAVKAMASPLVYVSLDAVGGDQTITGAASRQGVLNLGSELGGSNHLTPRTLRIAERAVRNLLVFMGILPAKDRIEPDEPGRAVEVGANALVFAPENGVFEPLVELGDVVEAGQPAARLHTPETPWAEPTLVTFPKGGFVLAKRIPGRTVRGDCLFQLATPSDILEKV